MLEHGSVDTKGCALELFFGDLAVRLNIGKSSQKLPRAPRRSFPGSGSLIMVQLPSPLSTALSSATFVLSSAGARSCTSSMSVSMRAGCVTSYSYVFLRACRPRTEFCKCFHLFVSWFVLQILTAGVVKIADAPVVGLAVGSVHPPQKPGRQEVYAFLYGKKLAPCVHAFKRFQLGKDF